jgi:hypothetical protein
MAALNLDFDFVRNDQRKMTQLAFNGNGLVLYFRRNALRQSYGIFANARHLVNLKTLIV